MTEDLTQVVLSNIFGELFNDNLCFDIKKGSVSSCVWLSSHHSNTKTNLCASEVRAYAPLRGGRGEAAGARFGARATPVSAFTSIPAIAPRSGRWGGARCTATRSAIRRAGVGSVTRVWTILVPVRWPGRWCHCRLLGEKIGEMCDDEMVGSCVHEAAPTWSFGRKKYWCNRTENATRSRQVT